MPGPRDRHEEETERRADGHLMEGVRQHLFPEIVVMVLPQDGRHRRQRRAGGFNEEEAEQMRGALIDLSNRIRRAAENI